ncbi:MAG: hypothetical protein AAGA37_12815 [Actinomycetota bacterium]
MIDNNIIEAARPPEPIPSAEVIARHRSALLDALDASPPAPGLVPVSARAMDVEEDSGRSHRWLGVLVGAAAVLLIVALVGRGAGPSTSTTGLSAPSDDVPLAWFLPQSLPSGWTVAYAWENELFRMVVVHEEQSRAEAQIMTTGRSTFGEITSFDGHDLPANGDWQTFDDGSVARLIDGLVVRVSGPLEVLGESDQARGGRWEMVADPNLPVSAIVVDDGSATFLDRTVWADDLYTMHVAGPSGSFAALSMSSPPRSPTDESIPVLRCCIELDLRGSSLRYVDGVVTDKPEDGVLAAFLVRDDVAWFDVYVDGVAARRGFRSTIEHGLPVGLSMVAIPDESNGFNERIDLRRVDRIVTFDAGGEVIETLIGPYVS